MWGLNTIIALSVASLVGGPNGVSPATGAAGKAPPKLYSGLCLEDGEIGSKIRSAADSEAKSFIQHVLGGDVQFAYGQMSVAGKASVTAAQFASVTQSAVKSAGPFSKLEVVKTYLVELKGSAPTAICGELSSPERWIAVRTAPIARQVYVTLDAAAPNNGWTITVWMEPEDATWRVRSFALNISTIAGRSAHDIWSLASAQARAGHSFNAALLYGAARGLAARGPNFQLGIQPQILKDMAAAARPPELKGAPPFILSLGGRTYRVSEFTTLGIADKLRLIVKLRPETWTNDAKADLENRAFLDAFLAARPELREVYASVVAQAYKPDGTGGFGTVYDVQKGYLAKPAP